MNEERRQILEMLSQGKITAQEAERLLSALDAGGAGPGSSAGAERETRPKPKYLRIVVESEESFHEHHHHGRHWKKHPEEAEATGKPAQTTVNIRVPIQLLRAGVKLVSLIPVQARNHVNDALREQGLEVDLSQLKPENLEELIDHISDLTVDVNEAKNKVRIFCE